MKAPSRGPTASSPVTWTAEMGQLKNFQREQAQSACHGPLPSQAHKQCFHSPGDAPALQNAH